MPYRRLHVGMRNEYEIRGDHVAIFVKFRNDRPMMEALVDVADFATVKAVPARWIAICPKKSRPDKFYTLAEVWSKEERTYVLMHRLITEAPNGVLVDHHDGDGLNNRRFNLRKTNGTVNNLNRRVARKDSTTGFRGVQRTRGTRGGRFRASVMVAGVFHHLGLFDRPEDAAVVVERFLVKMGVL